MHRLRAFAAAVIVASLTACSPAPTTGPLGTVVVTVEQLAPPGFFEPIHRGRLIAPDGSTAAEWEATEAGIPVDAPAGRYRLEVFTVFLSDFMQCTATDAAGDPAGSCFQPTLGPGQVCGLDVVVAPNVDVRAVFIAGPDGTCNLNLETG